LSAFSFSVFAFDIALVFYKNKSIDRLKRINVLAKFFSKSKVFLLKKIVFLIFLLFNYYGLYLIQCITKVIPGHAKELRSEFRVLHESFQLSALSLQLFI